MIRTDKNINDVLFILNNLRNEDLLELKVLWGDGWYEKTLESIKNTDYKILLGNDNFGGIVPIAVGGFSDVEHEKIKVGCAWLISSKFIKYNKQLLLKNIKKEIKIASQKYEMLCNYIFHSNFEAKKWLNKIGFIFQKKRYGNFEFFYKITERKK